MLKTFLLVCLPESLVVSMTLPCLGTAHSVKCVQLDDLVRDFYWATADMPARHIC